jgi:Mlc titration factor MtfA (ptsG expression regulator)
VFFEKPIEMLEQDPALYGAVQGYFRQDPATVLRAILERPPDAIAN